MATEVGPQAVDPGRDKRWQHILERLRDSSRYLMDQGSVSSRKASGRRVWSVRFYVRDCGKVTQKSIYIGNDPVLVAWTRRFINQCRAQGDLYRSLKTIERTSAAVTRIGEDRRR